MKGPDLILALFLYIDEHESPLPWIVSFWALGHSAGPEYGLINNAANLTTGWKWRRIFHILSEMYPLFPAVMTL